MLWQLHILIEMIYRRCEAAFKVDLSGWLDGTVKYMSERMYEKKMGKCLKKWVIGLWTIDWCGKHVNSRNESEITTVFTGIFVQFTSRLVMASSETEAHFCPASGLLCLLHLRRLTNISLRIVISSRIEYTLQIGSEVSRSSSGHWRCVASLPPSRCLEIDLPVAEV